MRNTTMRDALARVSALATPQRRPLAGREQVRNAAGGYVFAADMWTQVEDFLILGTTGGTYYVGADTLTAANVDVLDRAIAADGPRVVALITEISAAQPARAPKPRPGLFALAAAAANGDPRTVQAVKAAFPRVVRTTDHLAMFFGYWKNLAGKPTLGKSGSSPVTGRAMRTALATWFTAGDAHDVAFRALKARQRATPQGEAMSLRDVIRIAHPAGRTPEHAALIGWLAGRVGDDEARAVLPDVDNFLVAQAVTTPAQAIDVIRERRVPWEFLPPGVLADAEVWTELIGTIGLTALIRNLARMTRIGTIAPFAPATGRVTARLTDGSALARARVHPMDAYLALKVYQSGQIRHPGARQTGFAPVPAVVDALETAHDLAFGNVAPSGRRILVAVDSSGSMTARQVAANGTRLGSAYEVASTVAVMLARIEGANLHAIDVDTSVHASRVTPRTSLREIAGWQPSGGGTDLSLPFTWALRQRLDVDGILVLTDSETWAGRQHPVEALTAYRRAVNPAARVVVVSLTPAGYSIADHADEGVLAVAGLDASLPKLVTGFIR
jgi:60 kDa SS-A/Ro ribonucleoprotein